MTQPAPSKRILVALDTTDLDRAMAIARDLAGVAGGIKVGLELYSARGADGVRKLAGLGLPIFLDLKFHDIPSTVASAIRAVFPLHPFMMTVHASGGPAMLRAAAEAAAEAGGQRPKILAVTVLTSLDESDLGLVGQRGRVMDQVLRLAELAQGAGVDGVVCSPKEVALLRSKCGPSFTLVVPGIRPAWVAAGDQKRITTPAQAAAAGADYLVIGRPITGAARPREAAERIATELAAERPLGRAS